MELCDGVDYRRLRQQRWGLILPARRRTCLGQVVQHIPFLLAQGRDRRQDTFNKPTALFALCAETSATPQHGPTQWTFRASTTFSIYEQALEEAGIPFVTVAGSGFYDRPEVRDVLNLLRALADPWDDQALAGLLRSPAFGVPDVGIYQLRCPQGKSRPFREALHSDLTALSTMDQEHLRRAPVPIRGNCGKCLCFARIRGHCYFILERWRNYRNLDKRGREN